MGKRLRVIIKECRELLEKEVLTHIPSVQLSRLSEAKLDSYVQDTTLAVFLELATLRCVEVRDGATASVFSSKLDWAMLRIAVFQARCNLQKCVPFPLQWADFSVLTVSETALTTLSYHAMQKRN